MNIFILASLVAASQAPPASVGPDAFVNLMRGLHEQVHDVSFIYEGEWELVRRGAPEENKKRLQQRYQGSYAFRADGSTYLDLYLRSGPESRLSRSRRAIFRDKAEVLSFVPEIRFRSPIEVRPKNYYALEEHSPQQLLFYWFFQSMTDARSLEYEFQGWETIDGRKCAKVKLDIVPRQSGSPQDMPAYVFWVDLERGGHPLRVDKLFSPPHVDSRTRIKLEQFRLPDGKPVWFPISAVLDTFVIDTGKYSAEPIIRETYDVVRRTLRFNQGLPDSTFTVKREAGIPGSADIALRKEFEDTEAHAPLLRNDPASVQRRLDEKLAEADKQSRMIEASSAARPAWSWSGLAPIGLVAIGVALVAAAAVFWRRGSR